MKLRHDDAIIQFFPNLSIILACSIEILQGDGPFRVLQNMQFENHVTKNDVIMMSLPKTMENDRKMRTSVKTKEIYIVRKILMRAVQTCNFY